MRRIARVTRNWPHPCSIASAARQRQALAGYHWHRRLGQTILLASAQERERKRQLEIVTREFLRNARSIEVEIARKGREAATQWHRELPKQRRQEINRGYREARLAGLTRLSFADWLIEMFGG